MERRSLRYTDDTSDKFWHITLEGAAHTVSYGRVGTAGRTQRKEFDSEEAAERSFEKLVAARLKQGYSEIQEGADTSVEIPENWQRLALEKLQGELKQNEKQLCELAAIDGIPAAYFAILSVEVRKAIASQPATPATPLQILMQDERNAVRAAVAGNLSAPHSCFKTLAKDKVENVRYALAQNVYAPASALSELAEEPYIKVVTAVCENPNVTEELLDQLSQRLDEGQKHTCRWKRAAAIKRRDVVEPETRWDTCITVSKWAKERFPVTNWDGLTFEEFETHKGNNSSYQLFIAQSPKTPKSLLSQLVTYDEGHHYRSPNPVLGSGFLHRSPIKESIACNPGTPIDSLQQLFETNNLFICMGLARNHALPESLFLRLFENNDYLYPFDQRGRLMKWDEYDVGEGPGYEKWLHDLHWELARNPSTPTDIIEKLTQHNASYVQEMARKQSCDRALKAATQSDTSDENLKLLLKHRDIRVRAAVAKTEAGVPLFLETCLKSSNMLGRFIALMHPDTNQNVIAKAGTSKDWSDRYAIAQNPSTPATLLTQLSTDENIFVQAAAKTTLKIPFETRKAEVVSPHDLAAAMKSIGTRKKLPKWLPIDALPSIRVGDVSLSDEQVAAFVSALRLSTLEVPHDFVLAVKANAVEASLQAFVNTLFDRWQKEGMPSSEKWVMWAAAHLESKEVATKLGPLTVKWKKQQKHVRVMWALDTLTAMNSDAALMQLHYISQKAHRPTLRQRAAQHLKAAAAQQGISANELDDRMIPDCGLNASGQKTFDFGKRQFDFVLGPEMKPMVRDNKGKLRANLPKPAKADDPNLAEEAIADWRSLKKQLKAVGSIQTQRLERAMATARRWSLEAFETYLVRHPLMVHWVQRLLWAGHDKTGATVCYFRLAEDGTYADQEDVAIALDGCVTVSLAHRIDLSPDQHQIWQQIWCDYELIPPFPQFNREIYTPTDQENETGIVKRFQGIVVPGLSVLSVLEARGWEREGGDYDCTALTKVFSESNLMVRINYDGYIAVWNIRETGDFTLQECHFVACPSVGNSAQEKQKQPIVLEEMEPRLFSEVLRDLADVAAKCVTI